MGHRKGDGREAAERGDICMPVADSCPCMTEINTVFYSNYPPVKNKIKMFKKGRVLLPQTLWKRGSLTSISANE